MKYFTLSPKIFEFVLLLFIVLLSHKFLLKMYLLVFANVKKYTTIASLFSMRYINPFIFVDENIPRIQDGKKHWTLTPPSFAHSLFTQQFLSFHRFFFDAIINLCVSFFFLNLCSLRGEKVLKRLWQMIIDVRVEIRLDNLTK